MKPVKVAVVGATGLVGGTMLKILEERQFPVETLLPVASAKSVGSTVTFNGRPYTVTTPQEAIAQKPQIALFSAGAGVSRDWAPKFAEAGGTVVDNSSCWRMDPRVPLIVPEINGAVLADPAHIPLGIIANPNCSTIQMVMALAPLHKAFVIKRIVVSTYQSVSGTGQKAVRQMNLERKAFQEGKPAPSLDVYPHPIDRNVLPQIDSFEDSGYTKEEMKMVNETHKILDDYSIGVSSTTVRVPVTGGHSESVNVQFEKPFTLERVRQLIAGFPGNVLLDNPQESVYPMPLYAAGKDEVFVGRLRLDPTAPNTLNMWIVSDNLRKGAATNAVQIAQTLCGYQE